MLQTYKAVLRGDRLEWTGAAPGNIDAVEGVEVYVTIVQDEGVAPSAVSDGKAMAEALGKLAASGAALDISDPAAWQRDERQDRVLPGRDS